MLDLVEKTLHQMPLFVKMFVIVTLFFAVFARWNHGFRLLFNNPAQQIIRIIRSVCNYSLEFISRYQVFGLCNVMPLSAGQLKAQWVAQGVYIHMDFGAEPTSAASQGLFSLATVFLRPPQY